MLVTSALWITFVMVTQRDKKGPDNEA